MIISNNFGQATEYEVTNSEGTIASGEIADNRFVEVNTPEFPRGIEVTIGGHKEGMLDGYDAAIITRTNLTDVFLVSKPGPGA